jgi:hypothetical protein
MKKKLLLMLLVMPGIIMAQNTLTVEETTIPQTGGEMVVRLQLAAEDVYTSYQFKVDTPQGIAYVTDADDDVECTLVSGHDNSHQATVHWNAGERQLAVGVASMKSALLKCTTVELSIPIAETEAAVGTELTLAFKGVTFIRQDGTKDALDDVDITITIGEPDDGRIKFDENATKLPKYTTGEKADVKMTRTIKAGQWNTIVLPFTLTKAKAEAAFGSDVQLAEFSGFETIYADEDDVTPDAIKINMTTYTMTAKKGMTGGKPFLIKTSKDIESFEADDVTLANTVSAVEKADGYDTPGKLTGTLVKTLIPADGLFINGEKFWYSTGKSMAKAFRCWFELGAVLDKETDFGSRIFLSFDESETTGISLTPNASLRGEGNIYTLDGRKIQRSTLRKGVYVKQGKKVIVK